MEGAPPPVYHYVRVCSTLCNVGKDGKVFGSIRILQQRIQGSDRFIKDNKNRHLLATFVHVIERVRREQAL